MNPKPPRIQYIESIRGIAAFVVVFAHIVTALDSPPETGVPASLAGANPVVRTIGKIAFWPLGTGRLPVAIFFVLSGMALSQGFLRGGGLSTLQSAAIRRYFRLMVPSLISVLFAFALFRGGLMRNHEAAAAIAAQGGQAPWLEVAYTYQWTFEDTIREGAWNLFFSDQSAFAEGRLNSVLWTMRPELIGSCIVFGFLALFGHRANRASMGFAIAALLALAGFTMLALFPLGIGLAIVRADRPALRLSRITGIALLLAGLWLGGLYDYTGDWHMRIPITHSVINSADGPPCLGAVLVVLGLVFTPEYRGAVERRIFLWLGKISFGVYLCHVPIIMSLGCWLYLEMRNGGWEHGQSIAGVTAAVVPLSLLGGWVLYHVADRPSVWIGKALATRLLTDRATPDADRIEIPSTRPLHSAV